MWIKDLRDCQEFLAGDEALLRELLNARKEELALGYSLAHAVVKPGQRTLKHKLRSSEVYYILEGEGEMTIDDEMAPVRPGQAVYIPPHSIQNIKNTGRGDLVFLCIVDPAWRAEDEEVFD